MMLYKICIIATILCALFANNCANPTTSRSYRSLSPADCTYSLDIAGGLIDFWDENGAGVLAMFEYFGDFEMNFAIKKSDSRCVFPDNVTISAYPVDDTAVNGFDYSASNETFILSESQLSYNYTVTIINDIYHENLVEVFYIYYDVVSAQGIDYLTDGNPMDDSGDDVGYVAFWIGDDEDTASTTTPYPGVTYPDCVFWLFIGMPNYVFANSASSQNIQVMEDAGTFDLNFQMQKSDPRCVLNDNITVVATYQDGSAIYLEDYEAWNETFVLSASQLSYNYSVDIYNNHYIESAEWFIIFYSLTSALGGIDYLPADDQGYFGIFIKDDDGSK